MLGHCGVEYSSGKQGVKNIKPKVWPFGAKAWPFGAKAWPSCSRFDSDSASESLALCLEVPSM